jgi:hypothetical protein
MQNYCTGCSRYARAPLGVNIYKGLLDHNWPATKTKSLSFPARMIASRPSIKLFVSSLDCGDTTGALFRYNPFDATRFLAAPGRPSDNGTPGLNI